MKKIFIDEDQVTTLAELAKELAPMYGWTSYVADGQEIRFTAKASDDLDDGKTVNGILETSGFAYDADTGENIDDFNVDWDEDFDGWSNHVWAEDENGNVVMLHD